MVEIQPLNFQRQPSIGISWARGFKPHGVATIAREKARTCVSKIEKCPKKSSIGSHFTGIPRNLSTSQGLSEELINQICVQNRSCAPPSFGHGVQTSPKKLINPCVSKIERAPTSCAVFFLVGVSFKPQNFQLK